MSATPAVATGPRPGESPRETMARWQKEVKEADEDLLAGKWKKARRELNELLEEMNLRIKGGEQSGRILAITTMLLAIAESGLGDLDDATWDFAMALVLHPPLAKTPLGAYGEAGQRLVQPRAKEVKASAAQTPPPPGEQSDVRADVTAPVVIKGDPPDFPFGKQGACVEARVVVQMQIDRQGIPRAPHLLTEQDPLFGYAALRAAKKWRFRPAIFHGRPVVVFYNLTVNFRAPAACAGSKSH